MKILHISQEPEDHIILLWMASVLYLVSPTVSAWIPVNLEIVRTFVCYLIGFACSILFFHRTLLNDLRRAMQRPLPILIWALACLCVHYICQYTFSFVLLASPGYSNSNNQKIFDLYYENPLLLGICVVLLTPVTEECFFRRLIYGIIRSSCGCFPAVLLSAVLFASAHVVGSIGTSGFAYLFLCFLQYMPVSICLACVYEKTGNLICPVLCHSIINMVSFILLR